MAVKHEFRLQLVTDGTPYGTPITWSETGGAEVLINETVAANATNQLVTVGLTKAKINSLVITTTAQVTIKTNSSGSPDDTLIVTPNAPVVWDVNMPATNCPCPFTVNVSALYLTTGATAAQLTMLVNLDL